MRFDLAECSEEVSRGSDENKRAAKKIGDVRDVSGVTPIASEGAVHDQQNGPLPEISRQAAAG